MKIIIEDGDSSFLQPGSYDVDRLNVRFLKISNARNMRIDGLFIDPAAGRPVSLMMTSPGTVVPKFTQADVGKKVVHTHSKTGNVLTGTIKKVKTHVLVLGDKSGEWTAKHEYCEPVQLPAGSIPKIRDITDMDIGRAAVGWTDVGKRITGIVTKVEKDRVYIKRDISATEWSFPQRRIDLVDHIALREESQAVLDAVPDSQKVAAVCDECGDSGEYTCPITSKTTPCSLGCKKSSRLPLPMTFAEYARKVNGL